jgi:hypothetical protein
MFARKLGMFSLLKTSLTKSAFSRIPTHRTQLMFEVEKEIKGVGKCVRLRNNYTPTTDIKKYKEYKEYEEKSLEQFKKQLIPNHLHIYVHAASFATTKSIMVAGHVASFVTDHESKIIDDTVMSLQNGVDVKDENGNPVVFYGELNGRREKEQIYTVEFNGFETELIEFLQKAKDPRYSHTRHLISIPIHEEEVRLITEFVGNAIVLYGKRYFQMFDGEINGEFSKALNCCLGLYSGLGVKGKRSNPSPQLVTWSYLKFIFDERIRKKIITGTILDDEYVSGSELEKFDLKEKMPKLTGAALRDILLKKSGLKENSTIKEDDEIERINYKP